MLSEFIRSISYLTIQQTLEVLRHQCPVLVRFTITGRQYISAAGGEHGESQLLEEAEIVMI